MVKMGRGEHADEGGHQRDQHEDERDEPANLIKGRNNFKVITKVIQLQTYRGSQKSQPIPVC